MLSVIPVIGIGGGKRTEITQPVAVSAHQKATHLTPSIASQPDEALVALARQGDERAFRGLVERYESTVAATVIGMLGPGPEADDVGQETFIRFYRALHQFRGESSVGTYLTRIAINLSLNALKRRKRWRLRFLSRDEQVPFLREPAVDGRRPIEDGIDGAVIQQALHTLTPPFRSVVVLRLIEGYSTRETAEILGIPIGTVLSRLARAQRTLRGVLAPCFKDTGRGS
ncbi:hypothetical protein AWN76_017035 [Rhodothermaceae bacterium RA]|nr:hypothetical protein AWN76_017035 [Rhodothermaceae bacterium RA]